MHREERGCEKGAQKSIPTLTFESLKVAKGTQTCDPVLAEGV
jgi:hypothetical protein